MKRIQRILPFRMAVAIAATAGCLAVLTPVSAQQVQTGGRTTGTTGTTGGTTSRTATGTQTNSAATGAAGTGTNAPTAAAPPAPAGFVGGNSTEQFIGATREASATSQSANRQFRAIQDPTANTGRTQQQTGTPRTMPVGLRVGFSLPPVSSLQGQISAANMPSLQAFQRLRPEFAGLSVQLSNAGIATLTGSASSVETRRLAGNLIRFQPGVRGVDNRITLIAEP